VGSTLHPRWAGDDEQVAPEAAPQGF
jgi:hypothetical protein